jgi:hypothetical protein
MGAGPWRYQKLDSGSKPVTLNGPMHRGDLIDPFGGELSTLAQAHTLPLG